MLNKLRQLSWYYAVITTIFGLVLSGLFLLLVWFFNKQVAIVDVNVSAVSYASLVTSVAGVGGVFVFDKLSERRTGRIRWLLSNHLMWQFVAFIFTAAILITVLELLNDNIPKNIYINSLRLGMNVTYSGFSIYVVFLLTKIIFKTKRI